MSNLKKLSSWWCAPKLFKKPKCESHSEITEKRKEKVEAFSLICNTLGVEGHVRALGWD
jgi:hypothetical protein